MIGNNNNKNNKNKEYSFLDKFKDSAMQVKAFKARNQYMVANYNSKKISISKTNPNNKKKKSISKPNPNSKKKVYW